jgi:signal transduction histidine kinase/CheY-like chemotaxis protein
MNDRSDANSFLEGPPVPGTDEMRAATRAFDWSRTPLGPISRWSNSLRNIVHLVVNSRHPMFLWWGPDLVQLYNDAYRPSLGADRHPAALGARGREFWVEIWPIIGPQIEAVMQRGESTWNEDHLVPIFRNGRLEEVYWTYGYSPVWDDDGRVNGTLVVVQEQTARVLAARRVRTVRDLASTASVHRTQAEAWLGSFEVLSSNPHDIPWVLGFAPPGNGASTLRLVAQRPLDVVAEGQLPAANELGIRTALQRVLDTGTAERTNEIRTLVGDVIVPPWPEPVISARLIPIRRPRSPQPYGVLVVGLSPRLPFDEAYSDFLSMAADQVAAGLANAHAHEEELRLAAAHAQLSARFRDLLEQAPTGVAAFSGPSHRFEVANPIYRAMTHRTDVIGRPFVEVFPEVAGTPLLAVFDRVYATGEPFAADEYRVELNRSGDDDRQESFFSFRLAASRDERGTISGLIAVVADVTSQVHTRRELQRAQAQLDFTLASAGVGYWDLDLVTHRAICSDRHHQIFGYAKAAPGWTLAAFLGHVVNEDRGRVEAAVGRCAETGLDLDVECQIETIAGQRRWIHCHARVQPGDGVAPRLLGTVQDVTERRDLLTREQQARHAAEQASHAKDQFLATLSHELRTPMNTIVGWTDLLSEGGLSDDDVREGLATIQRHAQAQARMIEDLLDLGRIVTGKLHISPRLVALAPVLRAAVAAVEPGARAKGISLVELRIDDEAAVAGDPVLLQQIFWNLLGNAVKFTPAGGVISVVAIRFGAALDVTIRDTGQGIDAGLLPHIFDRFRQGDSTATRAHGGLGIGLSIVKQLVEAHGGTVRGGSDGRDLGASFTVSLPQVMRSTYAHSDVAPSAHPASPTADGPAPGLAGARILVVDDDADTRQLIARILTGCHATVITAQSAAEALGALHLHVFDLLIGDIGMPYEDGYELIRKVRLLAPAAAGRMPALALTAYGRPEDRRRALESGFQEHMSKPIQHAQFLRTCAALIEGGLSH